MEKDPAVCIGFRVQGLGSFVEEHPYNLEQKIAKESTFARRVRKTPRVQNFRHKALNPNFQKCPPMPQGIRDLCSDKSPPTDLCYLEAQWSVRHVIRRMQSNSTP